MKSKTKAISLKLSLQDPFFVGLKEHLQSLGDLNVSHPTTPVVDVIVEATLNMFKQEMMNIDGDFIYEKKEYIYPDFHETLEELIDVALNRRIHSTTLERICNHVEKYMDKVSQNKIKVMNKSISTINTKKELDAINDYISQTWDGFSNTNINELLSQIWTSAIKKTKNQFSEYLFTDIGELFRSLNDNQKFIINKKINSSDLGINLILYPNKITRIIRNEWDFEKKVNEIISEISLNFSDLENIHPKGWEKLSENYNDYDGMDNDELYNTTSLFKGTNSNTAGAPSFEIRVSLPHVMYDDKEQGRSPLETLVGSMLGHAYFISENNNGKKIQKEWIDLYTKLTNSKSDTLEFEFKEPLNKALEFLCMNNETSRDFKYQEEVMKILNINQKKSIKKPR